MKLYQTLAIAIGSKARCEANNPDGIRDRFIDQWQATIDRILGELL